jgi:predicted signal transduction protein with EAL and GGDEF domain
MNGQRIAGSASIGLAGYPESVDAAGDVLDKANVALYRSK